MWEKVHFGRTKRLKSTFFEKFSSGESPEEAGGTSKMNFFHVLAHCGIAGEMGGNNNC